MRNAGFSVGWALFALGCGGPQLPEPAAPRTVDPPALLLEFVGANDTWFRPPPSPPDALEPTLRRLRGDARRQSMAQLALGHLFAAEIALPEDARRHRVMAQRWARRVANGTRDSEMRARLAFVELWTAWRDGRGNVRGLAWRFTDRYAESRSYVHVAWMIRGEVEFAEGRWSEAKDAYRYVLGDLQHPLYGYALFRSAYCLGNLGREDEALDALRYVQQMGCAVDEAGPVADVAAAAAQALHLPVDRCSGRWVPRTCGCSG